MAKRRIRNNWFRVKDRKEIWGDRLLVGLAILFFFASFPIFVLPQEKGGRETTPSKTPPKRGAVRGTNRPAPKPKLASVLLNINPPDSTLLIDDQPSDKVDAVGAAKLTDLKPGLHSVIVRRAGYREKQETLELKAGDNEPVSIKLELLKGSVSVSPTVNGTDISLRNIDADRNVGTYAGAISQIEFPPGEYELTVSKKGYKTVTRRFTIKAGESAYLEPHLEPLPKPRSQIAMSASVRPDGKYLVIQLLGSSGADTPMSGLINVSVVKNSAFADVSGTFTGLPCDVDFVRLDNISDASLIEVPGPANQWVKAVVRVRPKDTKRPARFAINWRLLLRSSSSPTSEGRSLNFSEVVNMSSQANSSGFALRGKFS